MSQNGDDAQVRDAMINPVQRRESSAARFLKHFRPDRNNPAYHSEGKGLRKRRNWASERQLTTNSEIPVAGSTASANDAAPTAAQQCPVANSNTPQRSHSFSEPDAFGAVAAPRTTYKEASGMRESFRWRFSSKSSSKSSSSSEQSPKGGDTSKTLIQAAPQAALPRTSMPSSGQTNDSVPTSDNNRSQLHLHLPGGHFNNKSPFKKSSIHDSSTSVVDCRSGVHIQQDHSAGQQASSPSEPIYSNGKTQSTTPNRVNYYAPTSADADYVNYEMFSSSWSSHQKQLEPDLIRNLPYPQQSAVATAVQRGNNASFNPSPHHHSNRVHPAR